MAVFVTRGGVAAVATVQGAFPLIATTGDGKGGDELVGVMGLALRAFARLRIVLGGNLLETRLATVAKIFK